MRIKSRISQKESIFYSGRKILEVGVLFPVIFLSIFGFGYVAANAQKSQTTDNKADGNLKSSARVNPATRAMEFSLPLGGYPGRNGNSTPIVLNYSSKVWNLELFNFRQYTNSSTNPSIPSQLYLTSDIQATFSKKAAAGWTSSLQPPAIIDQEEVYNQDGELFSFSLPGRSKQSFDATFGTNVQGEGLWSCRIEDSWHGSASNCESGYAKFFVEICTNSSSGQEIGIETNTCEASPFPHNPSPPDPPIGQAPISQITYRVRRVRMQMPDGSSHEFRKDDKIYNCEESPAACAASKYGTYLAVDGTRMRLERGELQPGQNNEKRDVLYLPDGSRYVFPVLSATAETENQGYILAERYVDADGNTSSFDKSSQEWTDTMGQQIKDPLPDSLTLTRPTVGTQTVQLKGLNNQDRTSQIVWKSLGNSLENANTQLKYTGTDNCRTIQMDPVNGASLFSNQPGDPDTQPDPSLPTYQVIRNQRVCATSWGSPGIFNPTVMAELILPNSQKYKFEYDEFGEITKITYPSGGFERFEYEKVSPLGFTGDEVYEQGNRGVKKHYISFDGVTIGQTWTYGLNGNSLTAPDGSQTETELDASIASYYGFENPLAGMATETRSKDTNGQLRARTLTDWTTSEPQGTGAYLYARRDPRPIRTVSISIENGQALATMAETEYEDPDAAGSSAPTDPAYFARLNVKQSKSYQYLPISLTTAQTGDIETIKNLFYQSGQIASITQTDYAYSSAYQARGIGALPTETRVLNPVNPNEVLAKTQTVFDETNYLVADSGALTGNAAPGWATPNTTVRGKATTTKLWDKENNNWLETHTQYDQYGNVRKVWDASNDPSRFVETEYGTQYACAYPTKVITPAPSGDGSHGTTQGSWATTTYDLTTGLPLSMTDEFGQTTATEYNDPLLRPTRSYAVNFTAPEAQTVYGDTPGNLFVKVRKQIDADNWDEATTFADNLGRTIRTQTKDSQGDVFTNTEYDQMGRVKRATSPYRSGDQILWNAPRYDELGRAVESYAPAPDGQTGASLGVSSYGISTTAGLIGTTVTTTDASGRKSRALSNSLGQLARVDEPTAKGGTAAADLGETTTPNLATFYQYDIKGNMVEVIQGAQKRFFLYDSFGRLIRVRQPEQETNPNLSTMAGTAIDGNTDWTAAFSYDALGNVVTAIDAKGVVITNTYDKANRVVTKTYANEAAGQATPAVDYYYDGTGLGQSPSSPNYAKGKLTKVSSAVSETRYTQFDNLGRLLESEQRTPFTDSETIATAAPKISSYKYNLAGALTEETYPSGRVVKNSFNGNGDLSNIASKRATGAYSNYAANFSYTATGLIDKLQLGNGRWETAKFNTRQQITELALGTTPTDTSLWKLNYDYGELNPDGTTVDAAKNTGNIAKQTISFAGLANPMVQTYKYDSLYRITEAKEASGSTTNWQQNYAYDRYGNRTDFAQNVGGQALAINSQTLPQVDSTTNRFLSGQGYGYDKNGNIISDSTPDVGARNFTFNGDNKQVEVKDGSNHTIGKYYYDGEGKRVKKVTDVEVTIFVYSSGKLVAEYSTQTPNPTPTTNYVHTDTLQSVRAISDKQGNIVSRRDFMPFGEELYANSTNRTTANKYTTNGQDNIRQRFTGYEKDTETNLDFAEARYYNNAHGRFTAVDPLMASGKSANPQTFNRYVYVTNSPMTMTDPTGLIGDYYTRSGSYIGSDNVNDHLVYFADKTREDSEHIYVTNKEITTIEQVRSARQANRTVFERTTTFVGDNYIGNVGACYNTFAGTVNTINHVANFIDGFPVRGEASHAFGYLPLFQPGTQTQANAHQFTSNSILAASVLFGGAGAATGEATSFANIAAETGTAPSFTTATASGENYSVAYQMTLDVADFGKSRAVHFNRANAALDSALTSNSEFSASMNALIPDVGNSVCSTGGRSTPLNWVWHHSSESPGLMQLVPKSQHPSVPGGIFWDTMHPGGRGGYSTWAIPAGAPRN